MREVRGIFGIYVAGMATSMSIFQLYTGLFGTLEAILQRAIHLSFALALCFLLYPDRREKCEGRSLTLDGIVAILAILPGLWVLYQHNRISERWPFSDPFLFMDMAMGLLLIILVIEAARRVMGWAMAGLILIFLLYGLLGRDIPGTFGHRGVGLSEMVEYMYLTTDGIYGIPLGTSATMVVMFILFGAFLYKSGAGKFFMDLACSLSGKSRGGPAKIAVFASAFFGTISGAAVANVYATGTFTIPLMKRIGYRPQFAGAVEAAASTGGQLMPPVMGSAAFIMAEILGVSYLEVMKAAILPAILYFGCCLFTVHFEALKYNLGSLMGEEIPSLKKTLGRSYMLFAPMAIIFMLVLGYTPSMSALAGTFITILISLPNKKFRIGPNRFIQCLQEGAKGAIMVAVATAAAGLIVGVAAKVGLGFKVTNVVMDLSGGFLLLGSILIMIATIIMGMGVPTTAAYIMVAALGAPILIKMGVIPMAAHMFVFYYACISTVTPPVALSAYAGASIANSEPFRTGFTAFRLAIAGFIVPFMFVYSPALLLNGNLLECMIAGVSAFLGCLALAGSLQGWFWGKATIVPRGMLLVSALALIHTSFRTDVIGICLIFIVLLWQWIAKRKESAQFFLSKQTKFLR